MNMALTETKNRGVPTTGPADELLLAAEGAPAYSTLLLNFCHEKQENQAAIFKRFSIDAANNAFRVFVNRIPLTVT